MNRIIISLILISFVITGPAYATLSWTCTKCGSTFDFDPRDTSYMNEWCNHHYSVCKGPGTYTDSPMDYSAPRGRPTFGGALLLGGLVGGILGGLYGMVYAEPDMLAYAAAGAFLGCVGTGLLWIVSEE